MYDPFLLSSSRRARPRDASIVEISVRFPYKYRAAVSARRAFPSEGPIDIDEKKKKEISLVFFLSRDSLEISLTNFTLGLGSIETRLSRDYKVTSTFLTGMFVINLRITKVYADVYVCVCARARARACILLLPFFSFIHNGFNIQKRYLSIFRRYTAIAVGA